MHRVHQIVKTSKNSLESLKCSPMLEDESGKFPVIVDDLEWDDVASAGLVAGIGLKGDEVLAHVGEAEMFMPVVLEMKYDVYHRMNI